MRPIASLLLALALTLLGTHAAPALAEPATRPATAPAAELLRPTTAPQPPRPFDPTDAYELRTIEGWPVRVHHRLLGEQPELAAKTIDLLRFQLFQITRVVPAPALEKLRKVTVWVEYNDPQFPCMCYHAEADWLRGHNLNPDKTHGVELSNPRTFLDWTHQQPWMVFHELAHAYHDQCLPGGFENAGVLAAYKSAMAAKRYDAVMHYNGKIVPAYAKTNQMEYFAEQSEAYFGTNDFYPFVRAELQQHDPEGAEAVRAAWYANVAGAPATRPAR